MNSKLNHEHLYFFKSGLRGQLILPGDDTYDVARKVWNGMIDRYPSLIVKCFGVADVRSAVKFARSNNLLVAIRGGGHNVSGNAVCDGGMVIDLFQMKGARVNPRTCTAHVEAGLTWGEFDHETQAFGLATTGGLVSTTGIAGLTLGGGIGWLMRKHGLACDNLLSVDLITAEGDLVRASSNENQDLFWGVKGGGGNFGIVTSLEYRLHPVSSVLGGMIIYPLAKANSLLKFYRDLTQDAPDELTAFAILMTMPDGIKVIAIAVCYAGPIDVGEKVVKPLREFGFPIQDSIRVVTYKELQTIFDDVSPPGKCSYWKSNYLKELSDEAIDIIVDHFANVTSPCTTIDIEPFGGAVSRIGPNQTAFFHRSANYNLLILSMWSNPTERESHIQWARHLWTAMKQYSTSHVYVNYLGNENEQSVESAYGTNYERLMALKNKYDPTNFFRMNQNIIPISTKEKL